MLLLGGFGAGVVAFLVTGWVLALVIVPVAFVGLPVLLSSSSAGRRIERLEAMEEWTRSLSGVLTVGVGLEQALVATLRSTPAAIAPEVHPPGRPAAGPVEHRGCAARVRRRAR